MMFMGRGKTITERRSDCSGSFWRRIYLGRYFDEVGV